MNETTEQAQTTLETVEPISTKGGNAAETAAAAAATAAKPDPNIAKMVKLEKENKAFREASKIAAENKLIADGEIKQLLDERTKQLEEYRAKNDVYLQKEEAAKIALIASLELPDGIDVSNWSLEQIEILKATKGTTAAAPTVVIAGTKIMTKENKSGTTVDFKNMTRDEKLSYFNSKPMNAVITK